MITRYYRELFYFCIRKVKNPDAAADLAQESFARVPALPGLTLTTRMITTSSQYVEQSNARSIPGWTRWDIGARYTTRALDRPLVLKASVNNLFGRDYWSSGSGNWIYLSQPRTVMLSATMDF